jgi:lysine 2,3-aminomutase
MDKKTSTCPIGRQFVPCAQELEKKPAEMDDPILEEEQTHAGVLVHSYPNRVLLAVSQACAVYCRFCTRKRKVGTESKVTDKQYEEAFDYLRLHPEVDDVLLSGGDALVQSDERLEYFLSNLRKIESVRTIRIGSRVLSTMPQRITPELCEILEKYNVMYLNTHLNHPRELTKETAEAAKMLRKSGVTLGNQSVLLKGVNDNAETMRTLCMELYHAGIRPYYIYHCDLTSGDAYLRTTIETGKEIHHKLRGWLSGLAVPTYIFDGPEVRKTPINPDYCVKVGEGQYKFTNYKGVEWVYDENISL